MGKVSCNTKTNEITLYIRMNSMNKKIILPLLILFLIPITSDTHAERDILQE